MAGTRLQHGLSTTAVKPVSGQMLTTTLNATTATITNLTTTSQNSGVGGQTIARTSASVTKNASAAYSNVTGLSQTVLPGTYKFSLVLPSTVASGTGGLKYAFNYTTAVLSAMQSSASGFTASAVAVQNVTSTTTQADLFTQAAVVIRTIIDGTFVVTTGGIIDVQVAQNTSDASNTIALIGGTFTLNKIA